MLQQYWASEYRRDYPGDSQTLTYLSDAAKPPLKAEKMFEVCSPKNVSGHSVTLRTDWQCLYNSMDVNEF